MTQLSSQWESLIRPYKCAVSESTNREYEDEIVLEHLDPSFGVTLGHALKRILMSSLRGSAITRMTIQGALHEFSSIDGVKEDVMDIMKNLKGLALKSTTDTTLEAKIDKKEAGPIFAKDIDWPAQIEVMNPDHYIATINEGGSFSSVFWISTGKGYSARSSGMALPVGTIEVPALFNPIKHVHYEVLGQGEEKESLRFFIKTNGTISPRNSFFVAAKILEESFKSIHNFNENEASDSVADESSAEEKSDAQVDVAQYFNTSIETLSLGVRALNCLRKMGMTTIGHVASCTRKELRAEPSLGEKTLKEIEIALESRGLSFGFWSAKEGQEVK